MVNRRPLPSLCASLGFQAFLNGRSTFSMAPCSQSTLRSLHLYRTCSRLLTFLFVTCMCNGTDISLQAVAQSIVNFDKLSAPFPPVQPASGPCQIVIPRPVFLYFIPCSCPCLCEASPCHPPPTRPVAVFRVGENHTSDLPFNCPFR